MEQSLDATVGIHEVLDTFQLILKRVQKNTQILSSTRLSIVRNWHIWRALSKWIIGCITGESMKKVFDNCKGPKPIISWKGNWQHWSSRIKEAGQNKDWHSRVPWWPVFYYTPPEEIQDNEGGYTALQIILWCPDPTRNIENRTIKKYNTYLIEKVYAATDNLLL